MQGSNVGPGIFISNNHRINFGKHLPLDNTISTLDAYPYIPCHKKQKERKEKNSTSLFLKSNSISYLCELLFLRRNFYQLERQEHFTTFASWTLLSKVVGVHNSFSHH